MSECVLGPEQECAGEERGVGCGLQGSRGGCQAGIDRSSRLMYAIKGSPWEATKGVSSSQMMCSDLIVVKVLH